MVGELGKLHLRNDSVYLGISLGVGALNSCPNGLGHLFREELHKLCMVCLPAAHGPPEKSAPECLFECGGALTAIWAMPK